MKKRRIIVYIATSTDGYIARPDGDVRWLDRPRPKGNYGMGEFLKTIDTILWGRKTYGKGIEMGMKAAGFGKGIKNYVFSRQPRGSLEPGVEFISEPIKTFAQRLRSQPGTDTWLMAGAGSSRRFWMRTRSMSSLSTLSPSSSGKEFRSSRLVAVQFR